MSTDGVSLLKARQLVELSRWPEAEAALAPALADPTSGAAPWCLLAQCRMGVGDARGARRAAERGIAAEPDEEWPHRVLAVVLTAQRRRRRALASARRALELAPDLPETMHTLTAVLLADGARDEARRLADRSIALNPFSPIAWRSVAAVALEEARWADAEASARRGLALDPQDGDLLLQLGQAQDRQGRSGEAGETFAAAARADPTDDRARISLGRVGLAAVAGGVAFVKLGALVKLVWLSAVARGVTDWLTPALFGAAALLVGGTLFGIQEMRSRRARAQLSEHLQRIAARERRRGRAPWLWTASFLALVTLIAAWRAGDGVTAAAALAALMLSGAGLRACAGP